MPEGTPGRSEVGRTSEVDDFDTEKVEGMPEWEVAMQKALMSHTSHQVAALREEIKKAKTLAKEISEQFRKLWKEVDSMKAAQGMVPKAVQSLK